MKLAAELYGSTQIYYVAVNHSFMSRNTHKMEKPTWSQLCEVLQELHVNTGKKCLGLYIRFPQGDRVSMASRRRMGDSEHRCVVGRIKARQSITDIPLYFVVLHSLI